MCMNRFSVKNDHKWCCTYLLDATDSLFNEIGKAFIEKQLQDANLIAWFFPYRVWKNQPPIQLNIPPIDDPEYISSLGAAIFKGMQSGNDDAVADAGMATTSSNEEDLFGELMGECANYFWIEMHDESFRFQACVDMYTTRQYGQTLPLIQEGWNVLHHTIYNCTDGAYDKNRDVIVAFRDVDPSLISVHNEQSDHYDKLNSGTIIKEITDPFDRPHLWYSTSDAQESPWVMPAEMQNWKRVLLVGNWDLG
ncbi:hypothetical protein VNO78_02392 [Psophocarpus tetragonolobus]|uniref:Alpha-N-acetylglucosaminidase C-terminal domain-containing protein n=1 Tax=Psophocarpus tetragonolobus TaxID=3891 RepID=A0AAN9T2H0_PSOTE